MFSISTTFVEILFPVLAKLYWSDQWRPVMAHNQPKARFDHSLELIGGQR